MSVEKTHPHAPKAPGGFSAELCALMADHSARHPRLAPLLLPLWAILRRLCGRLDALLEAFRAGTLVPPEPRAPRATLRPPATRHTRADAPRHRQRRQSDSESVLAEPAPEGAQAAPDPSGFTRPPARPAIARAHPQKPLRLFSGSSAFMPNYVDLVTLS